MDVQFKNIEETNKLGLPISRFPLGTLFVSMSHFDQSDSARPIYDVIFAHLRFSLMKMAHREKDWFLWDCEDDDILSQALDLFEVINYV